MRFVLVLVLFTSVFSPLNAVPARAADCQFVRGFRALHGLIPHVVGDCLVDEQHRSNGDGFQETAGPTGQGGLLVWRKASNVTAFTDGSHTWIIGPFGLQQRPNTDRFAWETQTPLPAISPCRSGNPLANVHNPQRLTIVQRCRTVSGVVSRVKNQPDGDLFITLRLAPRDRGLLNRQNLARQHGELVLEIMPADQPGCVVGQPPLPTQGIATFGLCTGADIPAPGIGAPITVFGPLVRDEIHGWMEIHPVWALFPAPSA